MVPADQIIDTAEDFDSLGKLRSGSGTAAVHRDGKSTDLIRADRAHFYFYSHESCGQCTPVPGGHRLDVAGADAHGRGPRPQARDRHAAGSDKQVEGHTICALGDAAAWPIQGLIAHFRHEIETHRRYSHKADVDDVGILDPAHMVAAE